MKEIAWYVLGFAGVVSGIAFALLLAPDAAPAAAGSGGLLQHLTPSQWADLVIALVFAAAAFVAGSYLTSRAAAEADDSPVTVDLITAETVG
ncbi:hypothetical protein [Leifsonia sp. fls2-241-R2A-40a]|uniref:hypothetical protein n=1 Tax=Leifsonia sp. fls2-241-R2A-40a TaxID=3040290 RepID=UPI00255114DA|nr:hypothetical protein [Leifsonia sp. fls2-241-R2A-40a]